MSVKQRRQPDLVRKGHAGRARWIAGLVILLASFVISLHSRAADAPATAPTTSPERTPPPVAAGKLSDAGIEALLVKLGDADAAGRKDLLEQLARTGDQRLDVAFKDFTEGSLYVWKGRVVTCAKFESDGDNKVAPLIDPLTRDPILVGGKPARVPTAEVKSIDISRRDRTVVRDVTNLLRLSNPDPEARAAAVTKVGEQPSADNLPVLETMLKDEKVASVRFAIKESMALIQFATAADGDAGKAVRLAAAKTLGDMSSGRALPLLKGTYDDWTHAETAHGDTIQKLQAQLTAGSPGKLSEDQAKQAQNDLATAKGELAGLQARAPEMAVYTAAIHRIERWQSVVEWIGVFFSGLSASSILILMGLGLAIIFGLMGVINMAHGELMMIGAFATYETQRFFDNHFAGAIDYYFILAIPIAFLAAAAVGMLIETTVVRHLYGRPLDTLLATLGVSYILIWIVRVNYGNNIGVKNPSWLQGSFEIMQDVRLPYNRLFILAFCGLCIGLMYYIVDRTKLGLLLRATTQNRTMAASLGVSTRRIDMLTFGLGSGLAGMAGCALTLVGGVSPDMGQNYIIDSFMVVVVGGVGKLAGVIWSGLGLGDANKLLEPETGAVWAKVIILLLVVTFIQRKPSGLFPAKGRMADV